MYDVIIEYQKDYNAIESIEFKCDSYRFETLDGMVHFKHKTNDSDGFFAVPLDKFIYIDIAQKSVVAVIE